jgi:hypothetical protein
MNVDRDLARWDEGTLSLSELEARHPGVDAPGLARLRDRLAAAILIEAPSPEAGWAAIEHRLPRRPGRLARLRRPMLLAAALLVLTASVAYAAFPPVREGVNRAVERITRVFGDDERPEPTPTPSVERASGEDGGGNSGPGGGGGNEDDDGDDSGPSSSSGSGSGGDGGDSSGSGSGGDDSSGGESDDSSGSGSGRDSSGSGSSGNGKGSSGSDPSESGSSGSD